MERFRLRVRHQAKRGQVWEVAMFPEHPSHRLREANARLLGSASAPESIQWLRGLAAPWLAAVEEPGPVAAETFGRQPEVCWLCHEHGMRLALAFSAARYLTTPAQRRDFQQRLTELPSEVVLYWFTLCFYGYRQAAGRAALRTLFIYEDAAQDHAPVSHSMRPRGKNTKKDTPSLFGGEFAGVATGSEKEGMA
jgi:hypothetical protein